MREVWIIFELVTTWVMTQGDDSTLAVIREPWVETEFSSEYEARKFIEEAIQEHPPSNVKDVRIEIAKVWKQ